MAALGQIRWLIRRDLPKIMEIEEASFRSGIAFTEEEVKDFLAKKNVIGMVIEDDQFNIVGFMLYVLFKGHIHLIDIAVTPERRSESFGKSMITKLINKLSTNRRHRIEVNVRDDNLNAQLFFRHMGFKAVKIKTDEDGEQFYIMQYALPEEPSSNRISQYYTEAE